MGHLAGWGEGEVPACTHTGGIIKKCASAFQSHRNQCAPEERKSCGSSVNYPPSHNLNKTPGIQVWEEKENILNMSFGKRSPDHNRPSSSQGSGCGFNPLPWPAGESSWYQDPEHSPALSTCPPQTNPDRGELIPAQGQVHSHNCPLTQGRSSHKSSRPHQGAALSLSHQRPQLEPQLWGFLIFWKPHGSKNWAARIGSCAGHPEHRPCHFLSPLVAKAFPAPRPHWWLTGLPDGRSQALGNEAVTISSSSNKGSNSFATLIPKHWRIKAEQSQ